MPTTDLLDGQSVRVTGSGFDERFVIPSQGAPHAMGVVCAASDVLDACTDRGSGILPIGAGGTIDGFAQVRVLIDTPDGQIDCRTSSCELRVGFPWYPLAFARVPLTFDPAGPLRPSTLTVVPRTGLVDGQVVQIHGELLPQREVSVVECVQGAVGFDGCQTDPPSVSMRPDAQGTLDASFTVRSTFPLFDGERYDCLAEGSACVVAALSGTRLDDVPWVPIELTAAPASAASATPARPTFTG